MIDLVIIQYALYFLVLVVAVLALGDFSLISLIRRFHSWLSGALVLCFLLPVLVVLYANREYKRRAWAQKQERL